jgi:hypothetical protein
MPHEVSWLPREALDRMQSDLQLHGEITRAALAERIIADAAPLASYRVVEIATTSEDEAIALKASQYILDRELGKPKTSMQLNVTESNPVLQVLEGVVVDRPQPTPTDATVIDQEPTAPFSPPYSDDQET